MGVGAKAAKWNSCDLSLKSFAHMAVAAQIGCSWCLDFGYFQAFNEHLDLDKARERAALARLTPPSRRLSARYWATRTAMTQTPTHRDRRDRSPHCSSSSARRRSSS